MEGKLQEKVWVLMSLLLPYNYFNLNDTTSTSK